MQLQRALEDLLRHAERNTEQHMALSPGRRGLAAGAAGRDHAQGAARAAAGGHGRAGGQLAPARGPDLDGARAREIRLNAMEIRDPPGAAGRRRPRARSRGPIALRLNSSELVNAYETVGNHLYRLNEALAPEVEQDAAE